MVYGLFINTIYCYTGINDPSKDTTSKIVLYAKANPMAHVYAKAIQMAEVSCWMVNSRLSKIKAKMKTKMACNFSLLLKVSAKEQGIA